MVQGSLLTAHELYMREVRNTPQLTSDEEMCLLACLASGTNTQQARDRLVAGYQPLVIGLAKRFVRYCQGVELLDLVQDGNLALLQALGKYDVRRGDSSFRTFAFVWIRTAMLAAVWQYQGAIRLPLHKLRAIRQMGIVNTRLLSELGREPTFAETAQAMEMSEREVRELVVLQEQQIVSLHMRLDDDGDTCLEDVIEDPSATAFAEDGFVSVEDVLGHLNERERVVIKLRYGLADGQAYTQQEAADALGVALSTVQMIDRRAKLRLRRVLEQRAS
ncbi:MAG: sigma-70 family RNA polymerase sigma factor [Ktedonobacteraceae bacterium]